MVAVAAAEVVACSKLFKKELNIRVLRISILDYVINVNWLQIPISALEVKSGL